MILIDKWLTYVYLFTYDVSDIKRILMNSIKKAKQAIKQFLVVFF